MIYINDIPSFRAPESEEFIIDDRVEKIELINGNVVQDYGHIESGDSITLQCLFTAENYQRFKTLWLKRGNTVSYTDEAGNVHHNLRIVYRGMRRLPKFPTFFLIKFELWRV